jgi:hypothetical protein
VSSARHDRVADRRIAAHASAHPAGPTVALTVPDGHPGPARYEDGARDERRVRAGAARRCDRGVPEARPLRLDNGRPAPVPWRRVVADELVRPHENQAEPPLEPQQERRRGMPRAIEGSRFTQLRVDQEPPSRHTSPNSSLAHTVCLATALARRHEDLACTPPMADYGLGSCTAGRVHCRSPPPPRRSLSRQPRPAHRVRVRTPRNSATTDCCNACCILQPPSGCFSEFRSVVAQPPDCVT